MTATVLTGAAVVLLAVAVLELGWRGRQTATAPRRGWRRRCRLLAAACDRSRRGRRVRARLDAAALDISPSRWLVAQALLVVPAVAVAAWAAGLPFGTAVASGSLAVRGGAVLVLVARRGRRDRRLARGAAVLARAVSAEVRTGAPPPEVLRRAAERLRASGCPDTAAVVDDGLGRHAVGIDVATALCAAVSARACGYATRRDLRAVVTLVGIQAGGGGNADALIRLALAMETQAEAHRAAAATVADARGAALAIPVLALAVAGVVVAGEPAALDVALSSPALPVVAAAALAAVAGVVAVRRLTAA